MSYNSKTLLWFLCLPIGFIRMWSDRCTWRLGAKYAVSGVILAMLADVIDLIEYKHGIRTDGLTMSIYSSLMVAATPVCNAIFSAILGVSGYDQAADVALGAAAQAVGVRAAISVSYIWIEAIAYAICAVMILFFTVESELKSRGKNK
jgi:GPH family glycoside/pentoside/hexuronide:cation symporter